MSEVSYFLTQEGRLFFATVRKALTGAVEALGALNKSLEALGELRQLNTNIEALTAAVRELSSKRGDA